MKRSKKIRNRIRSVLKLKPAGNTGVYESVVRFNELSNEAVKFSTFFPKTWSPQDVVDAINEANNSRHFQRGSGNKYIGTSASYGIKIEIYLDRDGKIAAAYPAK